MLLFCAHNMGEAGMDLDDSNRVEILETATVVLLNMGFPARQKGYRYLREAVLLVAQEPVYMALLTKMLYPKIAKLYDTTDKQVERAIRSTIEAAWKYGNHKELNEVFGDLREHKSDRPTNKQVIGRLKVRMENEMLENEWLKESFRKIQESSRIRGRSY